MDDFDSDTIRKLDEGTVFRKGQFIEKNRVEGRVMEKRCKRCDTVLTLVEDDIGRWKLWCLQCDNIGIQR